MPYLIALGVSTPPSPELAVVSWHQRFPLFRSTSEEIVSSLVSRQVFQVIWRCADAFRPNTFLWYLITHCSLKLDISERKISLRCWLTRLSKRKHSLGTCKMKTNPDCTWICLIWWLFSKCNFRSVSLMSLSVTFPVKDNFHLYTPLMNFLKVCFPYTHILSFIWGYKLS